MLENIMVDTKMKMTKKCDPAASTSGSSSDQRARSLSTLKSTTASGNKASAPQRSRSSIKKAYVRFDDYLDLNEENMRRSCKRIMNKLYCEPGNPNNIEHATEMFQHAATDVCRPISPPPNQQVEATKSATRSAALKRDDHSNRRATIVNRSSSSSLTSSESSKVLQPNEKSYLRSQYERRQKRQLELMSKMQRTQSTQSALQQPVQPHKGSQMVTKLNLIGGTRKFNQNDNNDTSNINGGANNNISREQQLRHQQDLVAKSHELSKRRFFEQLERRESIKKNSNLSTQNEEHAQLSGAIFKQVEHRRQGQQLQLQQQPQQQQQQQQKVFPPDAEIGEGEFLDENQKQILQELVMHRKQADVGGIEAVQTFATVQTAADEHLTFKEHQTIVCPPLVQPLILNSANTAYDRDTLGMLSGPPPESILLPSPLSPSKAETTSLLSGGLRELSTNELIGFHTHSLQQKRLSVETKRLVKGSCSQGVSRMGEHKPLIEFSNLHHERLQPCRPPNEAQYKKLTGEDDFERRQAYIDNNSMALDDSAFEIKVPPSLSYAQDQLYHSRDGATDCFIDRLWVVRQVDEICPSISSKSNNDSNRIELIQDESITRTSTQMSVSRLETIEQGAEQATVHPTIATTDIDGNKILISTASSHEVSSNDPAEIITVTGMSILKEEAASSEKLIDTDAGCRLKKTIKLKTSDNQLDEQQQESKGAIINLAISIDQVDQGACEVQCDDADKMKKSTPSSSPLLCSDAEIRADSCAGRQTTSKSAADKNNSIDKQAVFVCPDGQASIKGEPGNKLQLADEQVASKSGNHECPETNAAVAFVGKANAGANENDNERSNNRDRIGDFNEAIANYEPVLQAVAAGQAQQVDDETSSRAIANERSAMIVKEDGALDASASEAASLETIITNKLATRDVPPEANGKMLNRQIGTDASDAATLLPPLDDARSGLAEKVAFEVGMSAAFDRDGKNTTYGESEDGRRPQLSLKLEENDCRQQTEESQLKRQLTEKLIGKLTLRANGALVEDEQRQQQREQALLGCDEQQYANPRSSNMDASHGNYSGQTTAENDVKNHDQYDRLGKNTKSSPMELRKCNEENGDSNLTVVNHSGADLIEPLYCKPSKNLRTNQSVRERYMNDSALAELACNQQSAPMVDPTIEEDIRSNCSSSGFGASVSAASSASSSESNSSSLAANHSFRVNRKTISSSTSRRSNSLSPNGDQAFDVVRCIARKPSRDPSVQVQRDGPSDLFNQQHLLVGPDQAYPNKSGGRPLLIENHGYASIVNRCQIEPMYSQSAKNDEQSMEFISSGQYANLPNDRVAQLQQRDSSAMNVEYATVRTSSQGGTGGGGGDGGIQIPPAENKTHSSLVDDNRRTSAASSEADSESSLSGHNRSMSSANSGGFSALPPVRLIDHNNFANNFDFNESLESPSSILNVDSPVQHHARKPSSLLKRFGSLVSRAFTLNNSGGGGGDLASLHSMPAPRVCDKTLAHSPQQQFSNLTETCEATRNRSQQPPSTAKLQEDMDNFCASESHLVEGRNAKNFGKGGSITVVNCGEVNDINVCRVIGKGDQGAKDEYEPKVAEADLVILPTKHKKHNLSNPQHNQPRKSPADRYDGGAAAACRQIYRTSSLQKDHRRSKSRGNDKLSRSRLMSRDKNLTSENAHGRRRSPTTSISSHSSLECSSLISSSDSHVANMKEQTAVSRRKSHLKRASSLSDELESLMSPSEAENSISPCSAQRSGAKSSQQGHKLAANIVKQANKAGSSRISIDCVSPTGHAADTLQSNEKRSHCDTLNTKSRSLLRWFGNTNSSMSLSLRADQSAPADCSGKREHLNCVIKKNDHDADRDQHEDTRHRSMNGFLSLIDRNHANSDHKLDRVCKTTALKKSKSGKLSSECETKEPTSLIYSSGANRNRLMPKSGLGRKLSRTMANECRSDDSNDVEYTDGVLNDGRCKSLNIYQSISRNYMRKHHHKRHHHNCGHHHHHHHHHCQSSSSRRHHCSISSKNRCGQDYSLPPTVQPCPESCSSCSSNGKADKIKHHCSKASVWGQLIKINKSDGSQVIELQRAPGRSWGFFVARGAINSVKGIFISRMHDSVTSSSLTGLLSIGDRILSIDDFQIEPDLDILRVNQMISKKCKILLKVKPFKG